MGRLASSEWIEVPAITVKQPIGEFYVGVTSWSDLLKVCDVNVRRPAESGTGEEAEEPDVFAYIGIQRPLDPTRVAEIQNYVRTVDACFPNTIIITVSGKNLETDGASRVRIRNVPKAATIIDGQHRLEGFRNRPEIMFQLLVTIFVDLELQEQAYLFSTINTKQTRINPSLNRDLLEFSNIETPEKIAHNVAKVMSWEVDGPWFRQIKMLGTKDALSAGMITQHAFVTPIIEMIYPARKYQNLVRSLLKEHKNDRNHLNRLVVGADKFPFWPFYIEGQDAAIKQVLDNYFRAVKETFPEDWLNPASLLSKTTGYSALMLELRSLIPLGVKEGSLKKEFFLPYLTQARTRLQQSRRSLTQLEFGSGLAAARGLQRAMFGDGR